MAIAQNILGRTMTVNDLTIFHVLNSSNLASKRCDASDYILGETRLPRDYISTLDSSSISEYDLHFVEFEGFLVIPPIVIFFIFTNI